MDKVTEEMLRLQRMIAEAEHRKRQQEGYNMTVKYPPAGSLLGGIHASDSMRKEPTLSTVQMIAARMNRGDAGAKLPHDFIQVHFTPSKVLVFVVQGEQYSVLEDEPDLFPSDKLITQLRLIR